MLLKFIPRNTPLGS